MGCHNLHGSLRMRKGRRGINPETACLMVQIAKALPGFIANSLKSCDPD